MRDPVYERSLKRGFLLLCQPLLREQGLKSVLRGVRILSSSLLQSLFITELAHRTIPKLATFRRRRPSTCSEGLPPLAPATSTHNLRTYKTCCNL